MGLSVETPLTPAWAAAMTASLMYLPGNTTTAMSGTDMPEEVLRVFVECADAEALADGLAALWVVFGDGD